MDRSRYSIVLIGLLLCACATPLPPSRISRMPPGETELQSVIPVLSLDELMTMAHSGASTELMIAYVLKSAVRIDLSPAQVIDLRQRGLPLQVLQTIHEERGKALRNEHAGQLAEFDRQCAADLERERQRIVSCPDPYWPRPYGYWGPYRRGGGMFWGW